MLLFLLLAVGVHVCFCLSNQIQCTTKQTQNGTVYTIPRFNATGCHFRWSNGSNNVIAVSETKNEFMEASSYKLYTKSCHRVIKYSRICQSEGEEMMATCVIDCMSSAKPLHEPANLTAKPAFPPLVTSANHWIAPVVVICFLFLVGLVVILRRNQLKRVCQLDHGRPAAESTDGAAMDSAQTQTESFQVVQEE